MDVFGGAPRFLAYPRPLVVPSGTDAVLKCQIAGDPRPTVIWERGNQQLQAEGRYRLFEDGNVYNLIISKADENDSGQYICKAKNIIGETYAAATLKVQGDAEVRELREENRPSFLIKPLSARVGRGEDAVFSCKLWGKPRPEVIWHKDGKKLNDIFESSHFSVSHQDGGWFQLKIFQTRAPDGGVYTCLARNEFGEALAGAVLLVDAGPGHEEDGVRNGYSNGHWKPHVGKRGARINAIQQIEEPLSVSSAKVKMFTVTEGKHAKFRCYVTGKPKPEIMWRKDGKIVISGRRHLLYEDREGYFTLKVLYCKQQDSGLYVCAASNTAGQTLSAVHLYVKEPARKFKQPLNDVEVREREQAVLECEVPDHSVPTTWYLEDRRLHPGAKYDIEQWGTVRRLTIRDIGADDDGIYLCEMADGERSIAEVSVRGTIVRKLPRKVDVLEGENAAFCVEVEEEEMDVHWYKDGNELRETHQTIIKSFGKTHFLVFVNASPQDSGLVTFIVGESKTSAHLRVRAIRQCPPSCPIGVQMNTERANAALMSWVPALDSRKNPPSGYVLERQEAGSHEWLQCLTTDSASAVEILGDSVPSEADYRFRICSFNKYGRSGHVEFPEFVHLVPVARIQTPLQDALVPAGTDAEFFIELSASVIGTWFLNGTQLQENEKCVIHHYRTQHFLLLKDVQMCDDRSEITFIAYGVRDSAVLCVQAPPVKFSILPETERDRKIEAGSPIGLYCEVSDQNAAVRWFKDGKELHPQEDLQIQSEGMMRSLILQSADFSHSGIYSCDVLDDVITFKVEVQAPPMKFAALPEEDCKKVVQTGTPVVLSCEVSDAEAQVCWYKDGEEIHQDSNINMQSEGTVRRLIIDSAGASHSGVYRCDSTNDAVSFLVDVKAPPVKFIPVPEGDLHKTVLESEPVVLYCELSRSDAPVHWYKDGAEIQAGEDITVQSEGTMRRLIIQAAKLSDSGVYACHAVDDTMIFKVNIREPPVTIIQPCDDVHLQYNVSDKIVLNCELSRANAAVHWYKNGHEILESEDVILESDGCLRKLTILNGKVEDSGEYVCDTNDDSKFYEVSVTEPAVQIVYPDKSPVDLRFTTSERVLLTCEVSRSNATVRWYRDGLEVERSENLILEEEGVYRRLILCCASAEDSGEYICDASDDSVTFNVIISEPPVKFLHPDKSSLLVKSFVGEPLELQCEVSRPNAVVCWLKDGMKIEEREGVCIEEDGTFRRLTIQSANFQDSGKYLCNAKDDVRKFKVKVTEAPVLILRKEELKTEQECLVSDDVVLECELSRIDGIVKWYKDGEKIVDNDRICLEEEGTFRSLVILNAEISDSGEYFCDAQDDSVVFHIKVKEPPVFIVGNTDSPEHHSLIAGDDLVLSCELSRPTATVQWYFNGKMLTADSRTRIKSHGTVRQLVISGLTTLDSGNYTCDAGDDKMVTTVTIQEPALKILNKEDAMEPIEVSENGSVTFCVQLSKDDASVQWLRNWREINDKRICSSSDGKSRKLTIRQAQLSDSGVYTCDASTDEIHFTLQVKVAPIKFEHKQEKPEEILAVESKSTVMSAVLSSEKSVVKWLRHRSQIFDSNKYETRVEGRVHSLIVKNTCKEDCGMYTCISQDDEMVFVVSVKELPLTFVRGLQHINAYKDDTITLRCELCKPKGDVQWLKDGQEILPSRRIVIKAEGRERSLTINRATGSDSGEYVCESKDDRTCAQVSVEMPRVVEFIAELHNVTVLEGEDATFKCMVSPEDAELVWHRNGNVVVPDERCMVSRNGLCHTLVIQNCQLIDSSKVTAEAEGVVSKANLQVQEAQVLFTKKLEAVIGEEHGEATLEVEVSLESGEVQWMRQGVVIQSSPKFTLNASGKKRSLTVHNLSISDRGTYRCETLHDRTQGKLMVEPRKISILKGLTDTETFERETATFEVELSHVDVEGVWQKDGIRVKPHNNWRVSTNGKVHSLTLSNLTIEDSGTVAFSGENIKTSARLTVKELPVIFIKQMEDLRIPDTFSALFECELSRHTAQVKWLKDSEIIKPKKTYRIYSMGRKRFLQIINCTLEDSGTYTCDAGDCNASAVLEVYEREVQIVQGLKDVVIQEDENAVFVCEISVENVKGEWFKNGEKIKPTSSTKIRHEGTKHFLLICNVKPEDSGEIRFVAKETESSACLEVEELPVHFVKPLRDKTALEKHRVILECTVSNPRSCVRWYRGDNLILPSDHYEICSEGCYRKLVIHQVTSMDEGTYSVQAGEHQCSARLMVEEQAILVVRQLADVEVTAPETACFECEVSVPVIKPPQWSLNGQLLQNGNGVRIESLGTIHRLVLKETSSDMSGLVKFTAGKARSRARLNVKS
ncbi:obscurin-like protein 1a isoform X2 [Erpetoichthys calabaricus]|uniref:obscurin-like protein 1a isoform X2 n=1 Tax=Erpetoichthys calabaricus TaxID=27687 RepID=UPI002234DB73|nr:obscurin-like protein 1a isoform X2 [Erpetoichthys calabaricus]